MAYPPNGQTADASLIVLRVTYNHPTHRYFSKAPKMNSQYDSHYGCHTWVPIAYPDLLSRTSHFPCFCFLFSPVILHPRISV